MIIDASVNFKPHTQLNLYRHLGIAPDAGRPWTASRLLEEMDAGGVDQVGLIANVVANGVGGEVFANHADVVKRVIDDCAGRVFGWVGIDPTGRRATTQYIEYAVRDLGFKGVHVYPHWFGIRVDDATYYPIYAKCEELGVPITLQVGSQSMRSGAKLCARPFWLDKVACDFPDLKLVGMHIGTPWASEMIELCRLHENVFIMADAHPPSTWEPELIEYLSEPPETGDGRTKVFWGTDHPVQKFAPSLAELKTLGLDADTMAGLLSDNARRILKLEAPAS